MVNETQSFVQYKDRAQSLSTDVINRVIGQEVYQQKLVPGWVDTIGQEIVNKVRVCENAYCSVYPVFRNCPLNSSI